MCIPRWYICILCTTNKRFWYQINFYQLVWTDCHMTKQLRDRQNTIEAWKYILNKIVVRSLFNILSNTSYWRCRSSSNDNITGCKYLFPICLFNHELAKLHDRIKVRNASRFKVTHSDRLYCTPLNSKTIKTTEQGNII